MAAEQPATGNDGPETWDATAVFADWDARDARQAAEDAARSGAAADDGPTPSASDLERGGDAANAVGAAADDELREESRRRARSLVADWRLHFDADQDEPLVSMIDAHLQRLLTVEQRVRELAEELQGTAEVCGGKVNGYVFADRVRRALGDLS